MIGEDKEDLWKVLGIYGVGGQLGNGGKKKAFHRGAYSYVRVEVRQGCDVAIAYQYLYG